MVRQCAILFGRLVLGKLIVYLTGIKFPFNITGMLLLTLFLELDWIKLHQVQGLSNFLAVSLGLSFAPPSVVLTLYSGVTAIEFWPIATVTIISTALVFVVTGWVYQTVCKFRLVHQIKLARKPHLTDFHLSERLHLRDKINLTNRDK